MYLYNNNCWGTIITNGVESENTEMSLDMGSGKGMQDAIYAQTCQHDK